MSYRVLLAAALTCCTGVLGESSVSGLPATVQAFVGGDVILPCSYPVSASDDFPTVEWSKEGLQPNVVFLYRDGCEIFDMKNPAFEYRTSLIPRELKNRNISLRIADVQPSDAGTYRCMSLWRNAPWDITTVQLVVAAVSEPKLSLTSAESGGVTLQCKAGCWLPEPEITFLDHQGNRIPADEPNRDRDAGGCYTVTKGLTLQEHTKRVTCRVYQPEINQTRTTEVFIPADCMRSCLLTAGMAAGGTSLFLLVPCVFAALIRRRCFKSADAYRLTASRKSSNSGSVSSYETQSLLQSVRVDNDVNMKSTIEKLSKEVADLRLKLKEANLQLEMISNTQLNSSRTGQQMKNSNLEPGRPILRGHRIKSNPDVLKDKASSTLSSASRSKKRFSYDSRLLSTSVAQHESSGPNLKRRHSSVLPYSISHHFKLPLDHLEEPQTYM